MSTIVYVNQRPDFLTSLARCHAKPHLNFQKWSEHVVLSTLDLEMCFAPQRRAIFSSLIWPDGSAPEPTFRSSIIGKKQCFATFLPCRAPASSFFGLFLFSDLLSTDSFSSLTLPISAFPSAHTVGSLTSKPPSDIYIYV